MDTITCGSDKEMKEALTEAGFDAMLPPYTHRFTITQGWRSIEVVRTDISEWSNLDLGLFDASGSVLWMVEGVDPADVDDTDEYLDDYIQVMLDNEEEPIKEFEWAQIVEAGEYAMAREQLAAWKAQA